MIIRKEFKYEMGHIVRNAWSRRCSMNAHGHSYRVEFLLKGSNPDNGQMLLDFGFIKQYLGPFVDAFDHSFWIWDQPKDGHIKRFFLKNFERVIISPFSTTAEMQAKLFYTYATAVLNYLNLESKFENGERYGVYPTIKCSSVIVHETTTGYAEYTGEKEFPNIKLIDLSFSPQIVSEWPSYFQNIYPEILKHD